MKYWAVRREVLRYITTLVPFGAKPYLWVSQDMLVTPLLVKSKSGASKPARVRNGIRKEPRQQSTWRRIDRLRASLDKAGMSSVMP